MYSFNQCLFQVWEAKSQPICKEVLDAEVRYHEVYLPNPEHLRQDIGSGRSVSGRIQQSNVMIELPEGALTAGIERMWLLDDAVLGVPTTEYLTASNVGVLHPVPKAALAAFKDFPGEHVELFAAPIVPQGIMFNSGDVPSGGFYLVFQSDSIVPFEMMVRMRLEINVNNV